MGKISVATMRLSRPVAGCLIRPLSPPTMRAAYWLQPPGAAPRSTQRIPGRSSRSLCWISASLNTARERQPSRCARLTNSSFACSASQRALLLERLGMGRNPSGHVTRFNGTIMPAMPLSEKQKKHLRRLAHPLHPLVMLGNAGLTDGVVSELDRALDGPRARQSERPGRASATRATRRSMNWHGAPPLSWCSVSATSACSIAAARA